MIPIDRDKVICNDNPDSDAWLDLSQEELEQILAEKQQQFEGKDNEAFFEQEEDTETDTDDDEDEEENNNQSSIPEQNQRNQQKKEKMQKDLSSLDAMVQGVQSFVNTISDFEGAEFPR